MIVFHDNFVFLLFLHLLRVFLSIVTYVRLVYCRLERVHNDLIEEKRKSENNFTFDKVKLTRNEV